MRAARLQAATDAEAAIKRPRAADAHTEALRTASAAHVVRGHLVEGEPCPVCEQVVSSVPAGETPKEWREARDASEAAHAKAETAAKALARAEHKVEDLAEGLIVASAATVDMPDPEQIAVALAGLDELAKAAATARAQESSGTSKVRQAREACDAAVKSAQRARDAYRAIRDELSGAGLVPPSESDDVAAAWASLQTWAEGEAIRQRGEAEALGAKAEAERAELRDPGRVIAEEAAALELEVDPTVLALDELLEAVAVEERMARDRVERLDADVAERAALVEVVAAHAGTAEVASELARLLDAGHFEQWLVAEALARLVDGRIGSVPRALGRPVLVRVRRGRAATCWWSTTGRVTSGVRSARCPAARPSRRRWPWRWRSPTSSPTLPPTARRASSRSSSTRASARSMPRRSRPSPTTIENLGADDRMVGIVTHVPELAARMPVQCPGDHSGRPLVTTVERVDDVMGRRVKFSVDPWDPSYGALRRGRARPERGRRSTRMSRCPRTRGQPIGAPADGRAGDGALRRRRAADRRSRLGGGRRGRRGARRVRELRRRRGACRRDGRDRRSPSVGRGVFSASRAIRPIPTHYPEVAYQPYAAGDSTPEALWLAIQDQMARREVEMAELARREAPTGRAGAARRPGHQPRPHRRVRWA